MRQIEAVSKGIPSLAAPVEEILQKLRSYADAAQQKLVYTFASVLDFRIKDKYLKKDSKYKEKKKDFLQELQKRNRSCEQATSISEDEGGEWLTHIFKKKKISEKTKKNRI